ncbi:uncharacterized protein LOC125870598 isoform X7 [Solanum stenotomum]|uniref:uncharacterized protein LOC125870598 isoform X7 n=1 Tax=Solanum stenotomum TaxID=172797 RepID=UPI0020D05FFB|nr:uncharacterized protein LOC125870598 isoform X7 [Solanum stenotomum]
MMINMIAIFGIVILALIYRAIIPPSPKICGSPNGPLITAPRVKLSDGRYLAYKENGVPRDQAKHKFVFIHGFDCVRHDVALLTTISPELMQSLGIYIVSIDRPGYGESDPHPKRTPKTLALDIEELVDQLDLGSKFYVIGFSMGGQAVWGLLKYIPHRLAGAILLTPVTNYWWGSFPANLTKQAYYEQLVQDQWTLRIAHYFPWLTYWWNTQKLFPSSSVATFSEDILFEQDRVLMPIFDSYQSHYRDLVRQQGEYESIHRDIMIGFGTWEFDPMELENPFPNGEGSVHIWQGDEDGHVPVKLQRFIAKKLPWIHYHEGPPVTSPRIKLSDGRYLAYKEHGVPRDQAKHKIVFIHGYDSNRHDAVVATGLSPEVIESLGVYIVSIDRPGYGESDPNPKRTVKSLAFDVQELADQLGLGSKFYVIGFSMGGQAVWTLLKYIPHRLAGAALLAPVTNYWWPNFPANLSKEAFSHQLPQDIWNLRVAHYLPWLTYWWNTQKFFPACSAAAYNPGALSSQDLELMPKYRANRDLYAQVRQQGQHESLYRDLMIGFGTWEFDPVDLENPFPNKEGSVQLWQGDEDKLVPVTLQRYIAQRQPWIQYHEIAGAGHMFPVLDGMADKIVKALLIGEKNVS